MKITFKEREYNLPSSLAEITLGQRIEFYNLYGKDMDERMQTIQALADEFERESQQAEWYLQLAACTLSFYAGINLEAIKAEVSVVSLLHIYNECVSRLHEEEINIELQQSYEYQGDAWYIAAPEIGPSSTMTFNEFLCAKESVRQLNAIGQSKWAALPYLCAIYLRKQDEPFKEEFLYPESDRLKQMHELPLNIAIAVGFFLSGTLSIYTTISLYSIKASQKESIQPAISTGGAG